MYIILNTKIINGGHRIMNRQDLKRKQLDKVLDFLEQNRLFSGVVLLAEEGKTF